MQAYYSQRLFILIINSLNFYKKKVILVEKKDRLLYNIEKNKYIEVIEMAPELLQKLADEKNDVKPVTAKSFAELSEKLQIQNAFGKTLMDIYEEGK